MRIDEVQPLAFKGCSQAALGYESGDWKSGFDLDSGANSRWEGIGQHEFEVFQLAGSTMRSKSALFPRTSSRSRSRIQLSFSADGNR
jgi:hypothetical protein